MLAFCHPIANEVCGSGTSRRGEALRYVTMLALAATSLLVAAWSPAAVPLLRPRSPRLAVAHQAAMTVMSEARTMPSGLVFEEITAGAGDSPGLEQVCAPCPSAP